jgi:hypothetical protein
MVVLISSGCAKDETTVASESADIRISTESPTSADREHYAALATFDPPPAEAVALAIAIKGLDPAMLPEPLTAPASTYQVGDQRSFWTHNNTTLKFVAVDAELMHISKHAYFWQDISSMPLNMEGTEATPADWAAAGASFDQSYERVRSVFGEEAFPGLDGDPRLFVIHADTLGVEGGHFGQGDLLPREVENHSNEGQYFYISNTWSSGIASDYYKEVLAHEFQHMVQKNVDPNEEGWMNEGLSMLAQQVAGMRGDNFVSEFLVKTDQSLWYWSSASEDYGQAFFYLEYLHEQLGEDFTKALSADSANGLPSIDKVLVEFGSARDADDLYADAMTAAFFNNAAIADGQYAFSVPTLTPIKPRYEFTTSGAVYSGTTEQYGGTDIMTFTGRGDRLLSFTGDQRVKLIPTDAHSGEQFWWSNRQDSSFSTLTRSVDLTAVEDATLKYWTWYDVEEDWDYIYLLASSDGGAHWKLMATSSSRSNDPTGQNLGLGVTGRSNGGDPAAWIEETVDLGAFAGQKILVRFAMQNDLAVNEFGFALDDLSIPEIGWSDDVEAGASDWDSDGFVLTHNRVPQIWRVRAVEQRTDGSIEVHDLELTDGAGELQVDFGGLERLVTFVIGQTRYTNLPSSYRLELHPAR